MPRLPSQIFRKNALDHATSPLGDVLRLTPRWTRWTYPLLVLTFATGVLYCVFGTIHEYATGPAVVWISGRTPLAAAAAGTVTQLAVKPGEHVEAGRLLVSLAATADHAELAIRAPHAGVVGDLRIRPGEPVAAGERVLTLIGDDHGCSVQAVLPAKYRPQLRPGMTLQFAVSGYRSADQALTITSAGDQVIGPSEVTRLLGADLADTLSVTGPVVVIEAGPCASSFTIDGQSLELYHGMSGIAEVRIRTQPILVALVPGLRAVFGDGHD